MPVSEKQNLRMRMRGLLSRMSDSECREETHELWQALLALPEWTHAVRVLAFVPLPGEPQLLELLLRSGKRLALPRTCREGLQFCEIAHPGDLVRRPLPGSSTRSLWEPREALPAIQPDAMDLALVPGLAFTRDGKRLGRGGGFYDRFLAGFPGNTLGVCFSTQIVPHIPMEDHDASVQVVLIAQPG